MSDVFLFTVSAAVTVVGVLGSWLAFRRRGAASGMRGLAWSSVPMAAYLTGLTKFASDLVFSPVKWTGVAVFGLGAVLYVASGAMLRRGTGRTEIGQRERAKKATQPKQQGGGELTTASDPDLADIEKILKDRGIT